MQVTNINPALNLNATNRFGHGASNSEKADLAATGIITAATGVGSGYALSQATVPAALTGLGNAIKGMSLSSLWDPFTAAVGLGAVAVYGAYRLVSSVLQK